jgi:hypothetical protein
VSAAAQTRTEDVQKALVSYLQLVHDQINPQMQEMRAERQRKVRDDSPLFSPELTPVFPLRSMDCTGPPSSDSLADTTPPLSFVALGDVHPSDGPSAFLQAAVRSAAAASGGSKAPAGGAGAPFAIILSSEFCRD